MTFVTGHQLSRALYEEVVAPLMEEMFPDVPYAAALMGSGSDVLGYDTERSMDHDWGPRLNVILNDDDVERLRDDMLDLVERRLPETVLGVPIEHQGSAQVPGGEVAFHNSVGKKRRHGVMVHSPKGILERISGIDDIGRLDVGRWLATPQQALLEFTAGPVFRDDTGTLTAMRDGLAWYPDDVWYALMAAQWQRLAQVEPFIGRAGETGDEVGSQMIAVSMLRDVMRLVLWQNRQYAPYAKWLGSAFARLPDVSRLTSTIDAMRFARGWQEREAAMLDVLMEVGQRHDALGITAPVGATPQSFFDRPYRVLFVERFSNALHAAIRDPEVRRLPYDIGSIDTVTDSTQALVNRGFRQAFAMWLRMSSGADPDEVT